MSTCSPMSCVPHTAHAHPTPRPHTSPPHTHTDHAMTGFATRERATVPGAALQLQQQAQQQPGARPAAAAVGNSAPFASLSFSMARPRVACRPAFASISSSSLFGKAAVEQATGFAYPASFCVLSKKHCPQLAGVGVRAKRILGIKNINVYTIGLYVDGPAAKKALHKHKGVSGEQLPQAVFDDLVASPAFEKSLRVVISYGGLKTAQFLSALEERLKPALAEANEPASTLRDFKAWFDGIPVRRGLEIAFASHAKGQVVCTVDGKQIGSTTSPALLKGIWDIYVGRDAVSPEAKKSFSSGLAALLNE